ncbi:GumC family protein [Benzoatithermus flavus]|uniref:non-specific protein-tyrosine kinase n=1 Tax=Benzoatithermus flavus TaxID=3108223 RepID=A0ABU8XQN5_9PROT
MTTSPAQTYQPAPEYYLPQDAGIDIKDLLAILRRRRWVILSTILVLTTLAVLIGFQLTPKYTAKALVMIDPRQTKVVNVEQVLQGLGTDASTVETQIKVLKSRDLADRIMQKLDLYQDPEFNRALDRKAGDLALNVDGPFATVLGLLPKEWLIATGLADEPLDATAEAKPALEREAAIDKFDDNLKVTQEGRSYVIGLSFTSKDPEKAAKIVNTVAQTYVQDQIDTKRAATSKASGFLGERLQSLRDEVQKAEAAVQEFRKKNQLVSADGVSLKEKDLSDLSKALISARAELAEKQAKLKLVRDLRARGGEELDTVGDVIDSQVIINLRQQEAALTKEESELKTLYGEKHPRMQTLLTEKQNLQSKIAREVDRIAKSLENEVKVLASGVATIEGEINDLKKQTTADNEASVRLRELERQAQASRQLYESFLERFKETKEQQDIVEADSKVISVATPPDKPSTPGPVLFGAVGFTASAMLGTLLALLLERLDNGLRGAKQVEQLIGLPTLGLVPRLERLKRNQKPHNYLIAKPLSAYAESLRAIYTSLQLSDVDHPPKMVLVTSSLPQEGKSTLSLSLACFAANSGQKVLLMDVDLRHPSVHRDLGTQPTAGLIEYMAGEKTLDEVLVRDEASGIWYLPIKRQTANPTDLLGSQKMKQLLAELRERFDFIVLDSAPLLGVTDSKVVARLVDKVLFAVQWEKTSKDTVVNALAHMREAKASVAGVVLTQVDVRKHAHYGYGDVGQYYGKYQKYYVN